MLVFATSEPSEHQDKWDIEHFQEVLQTQVREDILELQERFDALVVEVSATLGSRQLRETVHRRVEGVLVCQYKEERQES